MTHCSGLHQGEVLTAEVVDTKETVIMLSSHHPRGGGWGGAGGVFFEMSTSSFWNNKSGLQLLTAGSYSLQQSHLNQIIMAYIVFFGCFWVIFWYMERHVDKV